MPGGNGLPADRLGDVVVPATLLYVGLFALLSVFLANHVLYARLRARSLPAWRAQAAERVQGNFVENVPLALVLMYVVEISGVHPQIIHAAGVSLLLLRCLHAWGLARHEGANYPRLIGAQGTFVWMSIMGMLAILLWSGWF